MNSGQGFDMKIINDVLTEILPSDLSADGHFAVPEGVAAIGPFACRFNLDLISLSMPSSVTALQSNAFDSCENLETVEFSSNLQIIDEFAFCGCKSLLELNMPPWVHVVGRSAFDGCSQLKKASLSPCLKVLPEFMFCLCESLEELEVPNQVTSIKEGALSHCVKLKALHLNKRLTSIDSEALANCTSLETVLIKTDLPEEYARIKALLPAQVLANPNINASLKRFLDSVRVAAQGAAQSDSVLSQLPPEIFCNVIFPFMVKDLDLPEAVNGMMYAHFAPPASACNKDESIEKEPLEGERPYKRARNR